MASALNDNQFLIAGGFGGGQDAVIVDEASMNQQRVADIGVAFYCNGRSAMVSAGKVIAVVAYVDRDRRAILFDQATNQAQIVHKFEK